MEPSSSNRIGRLDSSRTSAGQEKNKKSLLKKLKVFLLETFELDFEDAEDLAVIKTKLENVEIYEQYAHYLLRVAKQANGEKYVSSILHFISYVHADIALGKFYHSKVKNTEDVDIRAWLLEGNDESKPDNWYCKLRQSI